MSNKRIFEQPIRRRDSIKLGATALFTAGFAGEKAFAQNNAKYRRLSLSDPASRPMVKSYAKAVKKMLNLPPTDPRNWYRNAITHLLDCPHGNWWFLPWHRGYLGWFEETCRELSGDDNFALPFWDWTKETRIPAAFFQNSLNPMNSGYYNNLSDFTADFAGPLSDLWDSLSKEQREQLDDRKITSLNALNGKIATAFLSRSNARGIKDPARPGFRRPGTYTAVSEPTISDALKPNAYQSFGSSKGSSKVPQHSKPGGVKGVLESQPHDNVHDDIGGFMGQFLSPVDPIFFMHHSNIDRLWDVWTRKQEKNGDPTTPEGGDLNVWEKESFLFFSDKDGEPVAKNKSGNYTTIGDFNYDYGTGTGDSAIGAKIRSMTMLQSPLKTNLSAQAATLSSPVVALSELASPLFETSKVDDGPSVVAQIKVKRPEDANNTLLHVLVNAPEDSSSVDFDGPHFAGSISFFGEHHGDHPETFSVPITNTLRKLREQGLLKEDEPLQIKLVADHTGVPLRTLGGTDVQEVSIVQH